MTDAKTYRTTEKFGVRSQRFQQVPPC
jgi:hypothetical protein